MLRSTRFVAMTLVLLVFATSHLDAQHRCRHCRKKMHASQKKQASQGLQTARQKREQRDVRRVQHTSPVQAQEMPPVPMSIRLSQNPLDDLQREFENGAQNSSDDFLDDLEGLSDALMEDSSPSETPAQDSGGRDVPAPTLQDEGADATERRPLSALEDEAAAEEVDADAVAEEDAATPRRRGPGLQDDEYYRAIGAPTTVRRRPVNQPLTMVDVFGADEEYDCQCTQAYCRHVWQCAGGRNQTWLSRTWRDLQRDRLARSGDSGCLNTRQWKCPKVANNPYGPGPIGPGGYGGQPGAGYRVRGSDPRAGGNVYYDDTSVIGDGIYELEPLPTEMPIPMVDET